MSISMMAANGQTLVGARMASTRCSALGMDRTGPTEIWTEDRETNDLPDWPLPKEAGFRHLLKRKPVVLKFATGTEVRLEEPGKNSHSQLGGIFVGEHGTIEIVRSNYPPTRRSFAGILPTCCRKARARTFRTCATLSIACIA